MPISALHMPEIAHRAETTIIAFWSAKNAHLIVSHCMKMTVSSRTIHELGQTGPHRADFWARPGSAESSRAVDSARYIGRSLVVSPAELENLGPSPVWPSLVPCLTYVM